MSSYIFSYSRLKREKLWVLWISSREELKLWIRGTHCGGTSIEKKSAPLKCPWIIVNVRLLIFSSLVGWCFDSGQAHKTTTTTTTTTTKHIRAENKLQSFTKLFCAQVIKPQSSLKSTTLVSTQIWNKTYMHKQKNTKVSKKYSGLPMTHGLRVSDAPQPKFTPFKFVVCVELTL